MSEITLMNIGNGVAVEKFQVELQRVIANIIDPNTHPTAKRSINITVNIKPGEDRNFGSVTIETSSKLAADISYATRAFFGRLKDGKLTAFEDNPNQMTIADFIEDTGPEKVVDILREQSEKEAAK